MLILVIYIIIQLISVAFVVFFGSYLGVKNTDLYLASCFFVLLVSQFDTLLYAKKTKEKRIWFAMVLLSIFSLYLCFDKAAENNQTVFEKPVFFTYNDNSEYIRGMLNIMDSILYNHSGLKEFRLVNINESSVDSFTYDDVVDLFNLRFVSSEGGYTASYLKNGADEYLFAGEVAHNKILSQVVSDLPMLKDISALKLDDLDLFIYKTRLSILEDDLSLINEPFTINKESKGIKYLDCYYYGEYILWLMMWVNIVLSALFLINSVCQLFIKKPLNDIRSVA